MLIDIHTHQMQSQKSNQLAFLVGTHSLGIHPWELTLPFTLADTYQKFNVLKKTFSPNILAIGECGLDRRHEGIATLEKVQLELLRWHLDWALEVKRPVIIHCVRAYSDLLMILKEKKYKGKILLHDFAGNVIEAKSFLDFDCYFSYGARLFHPDSKSRETFIELPRERMFFETDDQEDFSIEEIYQEGCELLNKTQEMIEEQMLKNLKNFFLDLNDISASDIINKLSTSSLG